MSIEKIANYLKTAAPLDVLKTKKTTYQMINLLRALAGVNVGNYEQKVEGEIESGHVDYTTQELLKSHQWIPVVKVICSDGWLEAQNTKGIIKSKL